MGQRCRQIFKAIIRRNHGPDAPIETHIDQLFGAAGNHLAIAVVIPVNSPRHSAAQQQPVGGDPGYGSAGKSDDQQLALPGDAAKTFFRGYFL